MDKKSVKLIVSRHLGEEFYKQLQTLEDDIKFFQMYMERNKKSVGCRFNLRISIDGSFKAFNDIWRKYGFYNSEIEAAFSEFCLLRLIIEDIYKKTNIFTNEEIKEFFGYFERYGETFVNNYVDDFIGCSMGCGETLKRIAEIREGAEE